jgi:hypothetical protein
VETSLQKEFCSNIPLGAMNFTTSVIVKACIVHWLLLHAERNTPWIPPTNTVENVEEYRSMFQLFKGQVHALSLLEVCSKEFKVNLSPELKMKVEERFRVQLHFRDFVALLQTVPSNKSVIYR